MRSQCVSTCTGREMATQSHSDVWTSFRQVPAALPTVCIALAPWLLPFCFLSVTWNLSTATTWERRRGSAVMLDLSMFPSTSGLLFVSNDAETFKHDLLKLQYCTVPLPAHACTLSGDRHIQGSLIYTLRRLPNQDKWWVTLKVIWM